MENPVKCVLLSYKVCKNNKCINEIIMFRSEASRFTVNTHVDFALAKMK